MRTYILVYLLWVSIGSQGEDIHISISTVGPRVRTYILVYLLWVSIGSQGEDIHISISTVGLYRVPG